MPPVQSRGPRPDGGGREGPAADGIAVTERQRLDAGGIDAALLRVNDALLRGFVLNLGWSTESARAEIERLRHLAAGLGTLETDAGFDDSEFVYRLRWQVLESSETPATGK